MNPSDYREFLKNSNVKLAIPILRCQESLELLVDKIATEENLYLKAFYTARAQRLLQSMLKEIPQIESHFREEGNIFILALLDEQLQFYEAVV